VGGAAAATGACAGCDEVDPLTFDPRAGRWDVGAPEDYDDGELRLFEDVPVLVGNDADGFYAMSALCTHRACVIGDDANEVGPEGGILCACHDSIFSRNGQALTPPAVRDLPHYLLEMEDGRLVCDTSVEVDPVTRLVPV